MQGDEDSLHGALGHVRTAPVYTHTYTHTMKTAYMELWDKFVSLPLPCVTHPRKQASTHTLTRARAMKTALMELWVKCVFRSHSSVSRVLCPRNFTRAG